MDIEPTKKVGDGLVLGCNAELGRYWAENIINACSAVDPLVL